MARPRKEIDYKLLDSLCQIQCTGEEIASIMGISYDRLNIHLKEEMGIGFKDYYKEKSASGRASLRRAQWKAAAEGNVVMQIWLGKNYLEQSDKREVESTMTVRVPLLEDMQSLFKTMRQVNKVELIEAGIDSQIDDISDDVSIP